MNDSTNPATDAETTAPSSLREFLFYFLRLGTLGFGGPIALAGYMQRDLVEQRHWIARRDYVEGLALSQLAPGPLAAQLAIYLGWVRAGALGASLVAGAFIFPPFLMVFAIAALYLRFGGLPWMQGAFYGIAAAVIAIIVRSAWKLVRLTVGKDWLLGSLWATSAVITAWTQSEIIWVFFLSGVVALVLKAGWNTRAALSAFAWPGWLITGLHGPASSATLVKILVYFTESGAFVFGSGLAIVPFLYGGAVQQFHWLNDRQFLDAVAVAMITPGPVVITVAFIGYLAGGPIGALMASIGVFVPCYLVVILGASYYKRATKNRRIKAFVDGVTAAATGAIAGAAYILGRRALVDIPTVVIAAVTLLVLTRIRKVPEPLVILLAGVAGILLFKGAR